MARRFHGIGELIRPLWPFTINRDSPQAQGLVRWWPLGYWPGHEFDLVTGQQLTNTGTTVGFDLTTRRYRAFSGTSQFFNIPSAAVSAVPFTLACWFNQTSVATDWLVTLNNGGTTHAFDLSVASSAVRIGAPAGAGADSVSTSTTFSSGVWNHACGVFASTTSRSVFLNGGGKATATESRTPAGIDTTDLGQAGNGSATFTGRMCDVRIYNLALRDLQVAAYFRDPRLSLDLYYPLGRRTWSFPKKLATFRPYPRPRGLDAGRSVLSGGMQ